MNIGDKIKEYRKKMGLTQANLAKESNISRSYLADLENNRYNPSIDVLISISNALNVSINNLLEDNSAVKNPYCDKIKKFRQERGISQKEMSDFLEIPYETYLNYESNTGDIEFDILLEICNVFNISPYKLLGKSLENYKDQDIKNSLLINGKFIYPPTKKELEEILHQDNLYASFLLFIKSKSWENELNYTQVDISEYEDEIFHFVLEILKTKINEIKYKNILKNTKK